MRVVVGLGSNVGDRHAHLREATRRVDLFAPIVRASPIYETAPVGGPDQGDYLNAAVLLEWETDLHDLLEGLLAIERVLGRERRERFGPRTIDLDILWGEGVVIASDRLDVPHPRLHERAFALVPLLDVVPDAVDPRTGLPFVRLPADADSIRQMAAALR